ncbi:DUF2785 domain-containing protein [Lacticaseibacillus daqingensis]|uniref:DUF2785 domain-containing protein n=1 Tax=Lacticaseibacillus daqingensis TaxID=2486014 RepID=UPI000F77B486|nr:DUF2785 domain-containing protein [Lacticaseibacillus daqingensis]
MTDEITQVRGQVAALRQDLLAGKVFAKLPAALAALRAAAPRQAATPVILPSDDIRALARIQTISLRVKKAKLASVSDEELDFLLTHLTSRNPAVRDKGVFFLLSDLFQADAFTPTQVRMLFTQLQAPDLLFNHILEPQSAALFGRSFAVMLLSGLVYADMNRYHLLTQADYQALLINLVTYILLERDGRGYVQDAGWGHAYTHIANLADELTQVPLLTRGEKVFLMAAVFEGWQHCDDPLVFGEDQRVAGYLVNLAVKHPLFAQAQVMCLTAWQSRLKDVRPQENLAFWNRWYNRSRLLEALLMRGDLPKLVVDYLQKIIDLY